MATVGISYNRFPEIAKAFPEQLHKVVVQTSEVIAQVAEAAAPKDTGFMASSIYVVSSDGSTYGQTNGPAPGDSYLLPEVEAISDPYESVCAVAANYAAYPNYGTRFQPAQPFWEPAIEEGKNRLNNALSAIESFL